MKNPNSFDFDAIFPIEWVPVPAPMGRKKSLLLVILANTFKPNVVSFVNRLGKTEGGGELKPSLLRVTWCS